MDDWESTYERLIGKHSNSGAQQKAQIITAVLLFIAFSLGILRALVSGEKPDSVLILIGIFLLVLIYVVVDSCSTRIEISERRVTKESIFPWHSWSVPKTDIRHMEVPKDLSGGALIFRQHSGGIKQITVAYSLEVALKREKETGG